jgi:hypothetical protein
MPHRLPQLIFALLFLLAVIPSSTQAATACGLTNPAFCDTFDSPAGTGNRSGQLNGLVWGVSHVTGNQNFSSPSNGWVSASLLICGTTQTVAPPNDVFICNGQLVEGQNDGGSVTALTMYPKQPFDFAGRTGKVTFDVSNDSQGNHAAWPEFWITDKPVPSPFAHEDSFKSLPQNGLGIRFAGYSGGTCPEGSGYVGVDSAITISNYVENDTFNGGDLNINGLDCVRKSTSASNLNHYEIDVAQNQIDVYGTDAGTTSPLKHLTSISNVNLSFTRGLIWIEDAHYNADKFNSQGTHSFTWDNVGFDGPVLPQDRTYDVPDNSMPNLGYFVPAGTTKSFTIPGVGLTNATGALLTYGFYVQSAPFTMAYTLNGHSHTLAWPYPYTLTFSPMTLGIPLVLGEVIVGANTLTVTPPVNMHIFNVDIVMVGAGGPPGGTPTDTPTPMPPTDTPVPTATQAPPTSTPASFTPTPAETPVPTNTPTPMPGQDCAIHIDAKGQVTGSCQTVLQ